MSKYSFLFSVGGYSIGEGASPSDVTISRNHSANILAPNRPFFKSDAAIGVDFHEKIRGRLKNAAGGSMQGGQLIVLLGLTGSGKSTMLSKFMVPRGIGHSRIIFGEPEGNLVSTPALLSEIGRVMAGNMAINKWKYAPFAGGGDPVLVPERELGILPEPKPIPDIGIIAIDSLRKFFYAPGKSTGAGGVNNEMFMLLTELGIFAKHTGLTFVVTLNPLLDDEEKMMSLAHRVAGSVDTTIVLTGRPADTGQLTLQATSRWWDSRGWFQATIPHSALQKLEEHKHADETITFEDNIDANFVSLSTQLSATLRS